MNKKIVVRTTLHSNGMVEIAITRSFFNNDGRDTVQAVTTAIMHALEEVTKNEA